MQEKAKQVGFEWDEREQVWDKVKEEMDELQEAVAVNKPGGDRGGVRRPAVFAGQLCTSFLQIDAENALERTNKKFISRFTRMEQQATRDGKSLADMSLAEMDAIWNSIKKQNPGT